MDKSRKFLFAMLIVLGVGLLLFGVAAVKRNSNYKHDDRNNNDCLTEQRIFDFADKLSDADEELLLEDIEEIENKVGMDFVVVTMDQYTDLSQYGMSATGYDIESNTKNIAEAICDYYLFGWEEWPDGTYLNGKNASTSVVVVANWQENDGYVYLCTSGKAKERISEAKAVKITQYGGKILRSNTLGGFQRMIKKTKQAMGSGGHGVDLFTPLIRFVACAIAAVIFFLVNFSKKAGTDTTTASTYSKGNAQILDRRDIFIRKEVHSVTIQSSSGGGGGGGSSGGGHGGGGSHF
ncbi:MAG: TPM domain-containing protein [Coprococcus sp.]|nr:TPM domain-containing protein [Coprococcus sp.]